MNFGKYAIMTDVEYHFEREPEWYWKIKPVTSGMELELSKFLSHNRVVQTANGRHELPPTSLEITFREIALSFNGTNIPKDASKPVEEGGEPILTPEISVAEIERTLKLFPHEMLMEIWRAVGNAYSDWGPVDPNFKRAASQD